MLKNQGVQQMNPKVSVTGVPSLNQPLIFRNFSARFRELSLMRLS
jgi:hypothetical protein